MANKKKNVFQQKQINNIQKIIFQKYKESEKYISYVNYRMIKGKR